MEFKHPEITGFFRLGEGKCWVSCSKGTEEGKMRRLTVDCVLVNSHRAGCFHGPTTWVPHSISAERASRGCYPFSQAEKLRLEEIKRLPRLTQLLRSSIGIQTQLFRKPVPRFCVHCTVLHSQPWHCLIMKLQPSLFHWEGSTAALGTCHGGGRLTASIVSPTRASYFSR